MVLLLALFAGASTIMVSRWGLGGPGAAIFVFAVGAVMGSVDSWNIVVERTLGTLWGAALAWLICALTDRLRTQEFIVPGRSEEHTSELQSLMRISYAVFCLKKKKNKNDKYITSTCITMKP